MNHTLSSVELTYFNTKIRSSSISKIGEQCIALKVVWHVGLLSSYRGETLSYGFWKIYDDWMLILS